MAHPEINNKTLYHFEPLFLQDEELQPQFVGLVKAAFRIQPDDIGPVIPMKEQIPAVLAGEFNGEPDKSSYKYEPECTPFKLNTDIVFIGTAKAPNENMTQFDCGFRVGEYTKLARIFGNRVWFKDVVGLTISDPEIVTEMPLTYENSFGGFDTSIELKHGHPFEQRNPVGKGYHNNKNNSIPLSPLPNIEDPINLITNYTDCPAPVGFGFTSPNWLPRKLLSGTYDEKWEKTRSPKLPLDFNPLFFNAASQQMIAKGYLQGNELVHVYNASPWPKLMFKLPAISAPTINVKQKNGTSFLLNTVLDTVIVNTDEMLLFLYYRTRAKLNNGPHDVAQIDITVADVNKMETSKFQP